MVLLAALNGTFVITAGIMVLGLALAFVVILSIAHARLRVEMDPKVEAANAVLPGANCGGCGFAGCAAYAEAVVKDPSLLGKCGPGGSTLVKQLADILGIEASNLAPVRAVVHCAAHTDDRIDPARYHGANSCAESQMVPGAIGCPYGCFGMGDCVNVCDFDAIHIVDGLATVDYEKCVGCGACAKACPRLIIEMISMCEDPLLVVACSSLDKAKDVRSYCKVGCVGCGLCAKMAPNMFQMRNNLAVIDYEKYGSAEERDKAVGKCPRQLLLYMGKNASTEPAAAAAGAAAEKSR